VTFIARRMELNFSKRLVPVAVIDRADDAVPLAEALRAGGLDVVEVTFRTDAAADAIRAIKQRFPDFTVGAGTLLKPDQVAVARQAGAQFGVAPGFNAAVVARAAQEGLPFIPGILTPTEIERALEADCRLLKFFPAEPAGGAKMLAALAAPYAHTGVRFIPLGGIHSANILDYLRLSAVAAVGGSWMVERKLIAARNWSTITTMTADALAVMRHVPPPLPGAAS
jgi:2-dehydro-3-deoxyphosphogluconate aldolase / (4S)-4-hydroxy-2-oxoglutarate aldolase